MTDLFTSLLSILAYLMPLIIDGIKNNQQKQKGFNTDANIQEYRKALAHNDSDGLSARHADQHDRVLEALRDG